MRIVQLLQCYLRAAEEPLGSDLDVAGLKAQTLDRIEARERERKELLAKIIAMAEAHGFDAGTMKVTMGG